MRQRVCIARTLVLQPRLILLDEPFGALDQQTRLLMGDELLRLWRETGATVLLITHALDEAAMLSDRIGVMSARPGRFIDIVATGWPRDRDSRIVSDAALRRAHGAAVVAAARGIAAGHRPRSRCRRRSTADTRHETQPRPHPHHPCRQPAAQPRRSPTCCSSAERGEAVRRRAEFDARRSRGRCRDRRSGRREIGIDVVSDGEMSKISYATYVARPARRLLGEGDTEPPSRISTSRRFPTSATRWRS